MTKESLEHWANKRWWDDLMLRRAKRLEPEMEQAKQMRKIASKFFFPNIKVLDVGCGCGHFIYSLEKIGKSFQYLGIDNSKPYIKLAKKYFNNKFNVNFRLGSIFNLSRFGKHDLVLCYMVLAHILDWQKAVKNLARATEKYCLIRTTLDDNENYIIKVYENIGDKKFDYYNTYKTSDFISCLKRVGFKKVSIFPEKFGINLPKKPRRFSTYTLGKGKKKLQILGQLILNWKVILAEK